MLDIMVSSELSLKSLIKLYLLCGFGFGTLIVLFLRYTGMSYTSSIFGGLIYLVVTAICFLIFAVDWELTI